MGGSGNLPIGPGVWGFIALFVLAIALWLLVRNMNARLRRMAYRERERLEEEAGSETRDRQDAEEPPEPSDGDVPPSDGEGAGGSQSRPAGQP